MARSNTIWERLWESTEGPTVTVKIPRDLAENLLAALSAACEMGDDDDADGMLAIDLDGPDMMGPPEEDDEDGFGPADDDDAMDFIMRSDDDDDSDSDDDSDDDDSDDDDDDDDDEPKKKEGSRDPRSDGMRPKTALGERVRRVAPRRRK